MNMMEAAKARILRGDIIENLYRYYGTDIKIAVLKSALRTKGFVEDQEIKKAVYYLGGEEKRYIHVEVNKDNWMNKVLETAEKEIARLEIMELCRMAAPEGVNAKIIRASLKKSGYDMSEEEILQQADYLHQKGLLSVVRVTNRMLGIRRDVIKITAAGIDYMEGNSGSITGIDEGS